MKTRIRIAVVGCGEVARRFHLPVLAGHPEVEMAALVDFDHARAARLAAKYGVTRACRDIEGLPTGSVDAAIVCTPPSDHARVALELFARGVHVLVEKPMATALSEAEAMTAAAERAGLVLAVALYRRLLPSARLARAVLKNGWLGRLQRIDHREGAVYGWPAATLSSMRKDLAGGGVLIDCGSHVLDQLLFILDCEADVLGYRDNSLGGIEADCVVELGFRFDGRTVPGTVELSRTRQLRNTLKLFCERGALELRSDGRFRLGVEPVDVELTDGLVEARRDFDLELGWAGERESPAFEPFRVELDDFLGAIRAHREPALNARSALASLRLIDACYRTARRLEEPGLIRTPSTRAPQDLASSNPNAAKPHSTAAAAVRQRRVLVTGATGFLGCRAAEILHFEHDFDVRAAVHNPGNASRVARLPVELVLADLRSGADVRRLVEGCDAVVHCAIGTNYGRRRDVFAVTVDGTRALVEAALAARVRRFVHVSSIAVYGLAPGMTIDPSTPLCPAPGDDYAESKAAAERVVEDGVRRGLPAVILRPTRIYGPFSQAFVEAPLKNLRAGRLAISRTAVGTPSQTVFVDDVVAAIVRALEGPLEAVSGRAFVIGDPADLTCDEFYGFFAERAGLSLPVVDDPDSGGAARQSRWSRRGTRWLRAFEELASSEEFFAFADRTLRTEPFGAPLRRALEASPRLRTVVRRLTRLDPVIYARPWSDASALEIVRRVESAIDLHQAQTRLGYRSVVPRLEAMQRTFDWAVYAEIIGRASVPV